MSVIIDGSAGVTTNSGAVYNSIASGTQTVQLVTAYITTAGTIQGNVKQTRVTLEFLAA